MNTSVNPEISTSNLLFRDHCPERHLFVSEASTYPTIDVWDSDFHFASTYVNNVHFRTLLT